MTLVLAVVLAAGTVMLLVVVVLAVAMRHPLRRSHLRLNPHQRHTGDESPQLRRASL